MAASKIRDIKSGMRNLTITGRVVEEEPTKEVMTRYGPAKVAAAMLTDDTGTVRLNLWRDQIEKVRTGDLVTIENAFATTFSGHVELNIGSDGRITSVRPMGQ